jgi:hypothetical protein
MSAADAVRAPATMLRRLIRVLMVAALVLGPLAAFAVMQALRDPAWWRPVSRGDAGAADRAAAFEQALVAEFMRVRPDAPEWAVRLHARDINDWLGTRLPAWLESRGEPVLGPTQASLVSGRVRAGIDTGRGVAWIEVEPMAEDGGVRLGPMRGGVGRLPVPMLGSVLASQPLLEGLSGPIRLADGRQVRVLDLELLDGEVRLKLRTEPGIPAP